MELRNIKFDLITKSRHSRNTIHSKHTTTRSISIRLKDDKLLSKEASAIKALCILNDLHGSSVMSAFELSDGFAKPIDDRPTQVADDVVKAYLDIQTRRKLV